MRERLIDGTEVTYVFHPTIPGAVETATFDPRVTVEALIWTIYENALIATRNVFDTNELRVELSTRFKCGLARLQYLHRHGVLDRECQAARLLEEELEVGIISILLDEFGPNVNRDFEIEFVRSAFPERWLKAQAQHPDLESRALYASVLSKYRYEQIHARAQRRVDLLRSAARNASN